MKENTRVAKTTARKPSINDHELRITRLERDLALVQRDIDSKFAQIMGKLEGIEKSSNVFVKAADALLSYFPQLAEGKQPGQTNLAALVNGPKK